MKPLFLLLVVASAAVGQSIHGDPNLLGVDQQGAVLIDDYRLFVRNRSGELRSVAPEYPSHSSFLDYYAALRRLVARPAPAGGEAMDATLRWRIWDLRRREAAARLIEEVFRPKSPPPFEAVRRFYEENRSEFTVPSQFSIRSIFWDATRCGDPECRESLKKHAQQALDRIRQSTPKGPVPLDVFLRVAESETGRESANFRVHGPFSLGAIQPDLERAALSLEPGEVSAVIDTAHGPQILRLESKQESRTRSLEEATPRIQEILNLRSTHARMRESRENLLASGRRRIDEDALLDLCLTGRPKGEALSVPLVEAGSLTLTVEDYWDYLGAVGMIPADSEADLSALEEFHRSILRESIILAELSFEVAESHGLTRDATYIARVQLGEKMERASLAFDRLLRVRIDAITDPTPAELLAYYDAHTEDFRTREEFLVREIAVPASTKGDRSDREFALRAAEVTAAQALADVRAGSPEETVVRKYSHGEEAGRGGFTPWLPAGARYSREVWEILSELEIGEWTATPIRAPEKVLLLKLEGRRPSEIKPFEEIQDQLPVRIRAEKSQQARANLIRELADEIGWTPNPEAVAALSPLRTWVEGKPIELSAEGVGTASP